MTLRTWIASAEERKGLRKRFPEGCRVQLEWMDELHAPPRGTKGTVIGVDDLGTVHVRWDNGSTLGVVYGVDECRRISDDEADEV